MSLVERRWMELENNLIIWCMSVDPNFFVAEFIVQSLSRNSTPADFFSFTGLILALRVTDIIDSIRNRDRDVLCLLTVTPLLLPLRVLLSYLMYMYKKCTCTVIAEAISWRMLLTNNSICIRYEELSCRRIVLPFHGDFSMGLPSFIDVYEYYNT